MSEVLTKESKPLTPIRIGLAIPTFNTAHINYVIQDDIDAEHCLDIVPTMGGAGSTNLVAALRSGAFDVVGVGTATLVEANAEGAGGSESSGQGMPPCFQGQEIPLSKENNHG